MPRTRLALTALVAAVATVLPLTPAAASAVDNACPADLPASETDNGTHSRAIDCLAWWGVLPDQVQDARSGDPATRGDFAGTLARLVAVTDQLPVSGDPDFTDVDGHRFAREIQQLASLGVISGYGDGTFGPDDSISRAQMASLMMRLVTGVQGLEVAAGPHPFTDVAPGSTHEANISRLVASRITAGVAPTRFDPTGEVTRGQLASFAARTLDLNMRERGIKLPDAPLEPEVGADLGTPGDELGNEIERTPWDAANSLDYFGSPLCSEGIRHSATMTLGGSDDIKDAVLKSVSSDGQTCVFVSPDDESRVVTVTRRPASTYVPDPTCFQFAGDEFVDPVAQMDQVEMCPPGATPSVVVIHDGFVYRAMGSGAGVDPTRAMHTLALTAINLG